MNKPTFTALLEELDKSTWQAVIDGKALAVKDDAGLILCSADSPNIIIPHTSNLDAASLQSQSIDQAEVLLAHYYRKHPLSKKGFTNKARALIAKHGATAFAAQLGSFPEQTLFVDGGEVIAENQDSPRHQYGAFYELENSTKPSKIAVKIEQWIESGEAYERYLEMNVCRYSC